MPTQYLMSQSTIIKMTTRGHFIRTTFPIYHWKSEINSQVVRSAGSAGLRISVGFCDAAEIFMEARINKIKIEDRKALSGGQLASGVRYNFFRSFRPIRIPGYVSITFFNQFYFRPLDKNLGYFILCKQSNNRTLVGAGISCRIFKFLTLSPESTITWQHRNPDTAFSEINQKKETPSVWAGLAIIYHIK